MGNTRGDGTRNFWTRKDIPILPLCDFDSCYAPKILGQGSYGKVETVSYRGSIYAAKHIHSTLIIQVSQQERKTIVENFLHECERCKNIKHPNIVEFYGVYYPDSHSEETEFCKINDIPRIPVMVMELMDKSLSNYIAVKKLTEVAFEIKCSILLDVAAGLSYLHQLKPPMIHRDLSPNNILLKCSSSNGNIPCIAKIADLGVAKVTQVDSSKVHTQAPGTPVFMPPEALIENPRYTTSLDVFSYGGVMLFVATHKWPMPTTSSSSVSEVERRREYLDEMTEGMAALKSLTEACLSNDVNKRPTIENVSKSLREDILSRILQGYQMKPPKGTPKAVHKEIMSACWDILPKQRPTFQDIVIKLRHIIIKLPKE